jgi:nucleoside-diphosphate-sugar epimerase
MLPESRTNVKRIVVTSSIGAVMSPPSTPTVFSEQDWNTASIEDVEKNGVHASPMSKYRASKTLAEKGMLGFQL